MIAPLELTGLTKIFQTPSGPLVAVKDVNAEIHDGEFIGILGHSGCGTSTVLSMIAGLEQATLGGVVIDGREVREPGSERGMVFQSPCLLPWLSARDNVRLAQPSAPAAAGRTRERPEHYLDLVGVRDAAPQLPAPCRSNRVFSCSTSRSRNSTRSPGSRCGIRFSGSGRNPVAWS